jgi:hypothetical protein
MNARPLAVVAAFDACLSQDAGHAGHARGELGARLRVAMEDAPHEREVPSGLFGHRHGRR